MNKRLVKRLKRQVSRAKERVKLSEPDLRTPEQIKAAREASRPAGGWRSGSEVRNFAGSLRTGSASATGRAAKADA